MMIVTSNFYPLYICWHLIHGFWSCQWHILTLSPVTSPSISLTLSPVHCHPSTVTSPSISHVLHWHCHPSTCSHLSSGTSCSTSLTMSPVHCHHTQYFIDTVTCPPLWPSMLKPVCVICSLSSNWHCHQIQHLTSPNEWENESVIESTK